MAYPKPLQKINLEEKKPHEIMTRKQIESGIKALSKDQKTACLAFQCEQEIKFLESEKMA